MIVVDTSAFISLSIADVLVLVLEEYDVHTSQLVLDELEKTAEYDDIHGIAAGAVLDVREEFDVHDVDVGEFETSRIDRGEASCVQLVKDSKADFLITDDLRALPELQHLTDAQVAISPILLRALVERGVLERDDARSKLQQVARSRDWLGAPIYRRAQRLFEETD